MRGLDHKQHVRLAGLEAFSAFNKLYRLGSEVQTEGDVEEKLYALAAKGDDEGALMLVSRDFEGEVEITLSGDYQSYTLRRVDDDTSDGTANVFMSDAMPIPNGEKIKLPVKKQEILYLNCI